VNLTQNTIHLDHRVPHVEVLPEGRVLKTETSKRHIPLVGVSLAAMRLQPQGERRRLAVLPLEDHVTALVWGAGHHARFAGQ
jgi:hypothetical protein